MKGYYEFTLKFKKGETESVIERRYSDFLLLRDALECMHPGLFIHPLPPKELLIFMTKEDAQTIKLRKQGILNFLEVIASH